MKWFIFLAASLAMMAVAPCSAMCAESSGLATIESISHHVVSESQEKLVFKLNGSIVPKIFTMKGENPRLVIDLPKTVYTGKNVIAVVEGKLATAVRTGIHQMPEPKIRVVVDLVKNVAVGHSSLLSNEDNTLTIELTREERAPLNQSEAQDVRKDQALPHLPIADKTPAAPVEQKPVVPVLPAPESTVKPETAAAAPPPAAAAPTSAAPELPADSVAGSKPVQLLDVAFDDSSQRGEMVLFQLTAFHPPVVSAVEKDNPRVFCDFVGIESGKGLEETLVTKGKFVERIVISRQGKPDKVRVVLHLFPKRDYDLQQVFFKNDNLFVLIINELPPEKQQ